jgi:2'-5' RNA ligase
MNYLPQERQAQMGGEGKNPTLENNPILCAAFPMEREFAVDLADLWKHVALIPRGCIDLPIMSFHLTMIDLGSVRQKYVNTAIEGIECRIKELPNCEFRFNSFRVLASRTVAQKSYIAAVAWVKEDDAWNAFHRRLRKSLQEMLAPQLDDRPWTPHVSIAKFLQSETEAVQINQVFVYPYRWQPKTVSIYCKETPTSTNKIIRTYPLPPA